MNKISRRFTKNRICESSDDMTMPVRREQMQGSYQSGKPGEWSEFLQISWKNKISLKSHGKDMKFFPVLPKRENQLSLAFPGLCMAR